MDGLWPMDINGFRRNRMESGLLTIVINVSEFNILIGFSIVFESRLLQRTSQTVGVVNYSHNEKKKIRLISNDYFVDEMT